MAEPSSDRRASDRMHVLGGLHGEVTVFQPIGIQELGRSGAVVETTFPLHLDSLHDFRLALGDHSVIVKGRVVHSHISDVDQETVLYRSGIEFIEPPARVCDVITNFLEAVKDGRRGL